MVNKLRIDTYINRNKQRESVSTSERQDEERCHGKQERDRGGLHPQGTHTEGRTPQRTHHRRGGPHKGPTQNTHRHKRTL